MPLPYFSHNTMIPELVKNEDVIIAPAIRVMQTRSTGNWGEFDLSHLDLLCTFSGLESFRKS